MKEMKEMKEWTLEEAKKDYVLSNPSCSNCKFCYQLETGEGLFKSISLMCQVKDDFCCNQCPSICDYFTLSDKVKKDLGID